MEEVKFELDSIKNIYSDFSSENNKTLKREFVDHLENACDEVPAFEDFRVLISCQNEVSKNEEQLAINTIKKHYKKKFINSKKSIMRNTFISLSMLVISIVLIFVLHFLNVYKVNYIITTLLDIIAWVFAWEFTDISFLKMQKIGVINVFIKSY